MKQLRTKQRLRVTNVFMMKMVIIEAMTKYQSKGYSSFYLSNLAISIPMRRNKSSSLRIAVIQTMLVVLMLLLGDMFMNEYLSWTRPHTIV